MDQHADVRQQLAQREARHFTRAVTELIAAHPHPHGPTVRILLTDTTTGQALGQVDIDVTNLWSLAWYASYRATTPTATTPTITPTGRPALRVLGGGR